MALTLLATNNAESTLASAISATDTSLIVSAGTGAEFPDAVAGESYFKLTLTDAATGSQVEIVNVTAKAGDIFTIERAQEGTLARAWLANDMVANMMTADTLNIIAQYTEQAADSAAQAAQSAAAATEFADNKFTFPTTAAGLAATTNGQYFRVPQGVDNDTSFIYYQNNSGVAVESAALPGAESIAELNRKITYDDLQLIGTLGGDDSNACILVDQYGEVFLVGIGGQSLQYKLKLIDKRINVNSSGNIQEFQDFTGNKVAFFDSLGGLFIPGLGNLSVQDKIKVLESISSYSSSQAMFTSIDKLKNKVSFVDQYGSLFLPGMSGVSLQDSIKGIKKNVNTDRSPFIKKLTDAQSRALEFTDEDGKYYLKGFGAKSLEDHFKSLKNRVNTLYKAKAIFDAWLDFGIDWNGNESISLQLQTAVNYVSKLPYGGEIVLRPGVYRLHTYITAKPNVTIRCVPGAVFMPMLANAAFYYRSPQEIYLENFNLIDVEIDGSEQHSPSYDVGAKGTYLQYFRQCMFLRCNVHDTGATGIGNDYPDRSFVLDCYTDNCGRLAPDGSGGASGIGIGLGAIQDEALIVTRAITRNCKNFGMFFEQQRLSGPGQPYVARQIIVSDVVSTGNGHGFGDCGASGLLVINGQFNDNLKTGISIDAGTLANNGIAPRPGKNGSMVNCQVERNGVTGLHYDSTKIQADGGYSFSDMHINDNAQDAILIEAGANTLADVRFDNMDIKNNGRYPVNVASGTFTDLDFTNLRMLRNGGDTAFKLDGNITRGTIHNCKLRSQNGAAAITGGGNISNFDIAENQYTDTNSNPINLTGTLTNVTYGRNPGLE
ncbi:right-handed parallel beta-helix repeat-containing protein [Klebsiella pneumoniae]|uniref:right-handed parallel beta-helix repeat-containing protein n=1 Tax=Klebsiella pneumoniae TaxID=573 RepID=UPI00044CE478|nr:right-handed parallel beta-helix repeat-containing protein [Klebsiella pneumoniae]EWE61714.1 hypothetical protein L451_06067 [Klebsiella pneumoniae BIDMC 18D]